MCDYSLHHVKSRPAKVGDKLTTRQFDSLTTGFAAPEDASMAVCVLPGTELAFATKSPGKRPELIRPQLSSGRSIRTSRTHIMMRWSLQTVNLCS
jgi:hypothetical protein